MNISASSGWIQPLIFFPRLRWKFGQVRKIVSHQYVLANNGLHPTCAMYTGINYMMKQKDQL